MVSVKQCLFPDCCSYQTVLRPAIEASAVPYLIKCGINTFDEMKWQSAANGVNTFSAEKCPATCLRSDFLATIDR